ncbi:M12 family metallopeptidase [Pseudoalteromonas aurantia]|uniref:Peptidase M12A domain-containing protein n=1 Tax=Pseudoalteromonas aurantia 208 TaxID=1314867 RepID=A0ABR9EEB6_9GAMM|nr:M12 family metallopeptidase [Pseudoalteromonas aurantia]MBE0369331.1 hypothetical protein [Pseudoalteromonas aurantia 208]
MRFKFTFLFLLLSSQINANNNEYIIEGVDELGQEVNQKIKVENKNGKILYQGDILVSGVNIRDVFDISPMAIVKPSNYRWRNGDDSIAYFRFNGLDFRQRQAVYHAMSVIERSSGVRFKESQSEKDIIEIVKSGDSECYSQVGKVGGIQELGLGNGCFTGSIIIHELLHALGFWHEQSRSDRDNHILIHWDNIREEKKHNFNKQVGGNLGNYDYKSIMHYSNNSWAIDKTKPTITAISDPNLILGSNSLSSTDISTLQNMYGVTPKLRASSGQCGGNYDLYWSMPKQGGYHEYYAEIYLDNEFYRDSDFRFGETSIKIYSNSSVKVRLCESVQGYCGTFSNTVYLPRDTSDDCDRGPRD